MSSPSSLAPQGSIWRAAVIAWVTAAATAGVFVCVGRMVDAFVVRAPLPRLVAGVALLLCLVAAGGALLTGWLPQLWAAVLESRLRLAILARVQGQGPVAGAGQDGSLVSLSTDAVEKASRYRAGFVGPIIGAMSTPLVVLAVMALMVDPAIAGWLTALMVIVPLAVGGFQRAVQPVGASYRRAQGQLTAAFLEAIQGLDSLVYARAADRTEEQLRERGEGLRRPLMRMLAGNQVLIFVIDAAFSLSIVVAATGLAGSRLLDGSLSAGQALTILLLTVLIIGPVDVVGQFFYIGISGRAAERQLAEFLQHPPADRPTPVVGSDPVAEPGIRLRGVSSGWVQGQDVVRDLDLEVAPGERVALVGPSGVGKSTVSALIQGHLLPRSGSVHVDGLDTRTTDPAHLRSRLAVVEQRPYLFEGSIADNLLLADPHADLTRLWQALELAGLADEVRAMPHGLEQQVGEHGMLLSGGQAQRLAIARAALRDAPVLVLDEPTSQVDLQAEASILAALERLAHGRAVLMIAHRPEAILSADRVVELDQAQVAA